MSELRRDDISLSVIVPGLNEEGNIRPSIEELIEALRGVVLDWEVILIDDGSTDRTGEIAEELAGWDKKIRVIHHDRPRGIGYSFQEGVRVAEKTVVTWVPADGENDPKELLKYLPLMRYVDIVIPFVINKEVRPILRRILSAVYLTIINTTFGTRFNYTNGNIIYRKAVFNVVRPRSSGFLLHAECLVRAIRSRFIFAEVPVTLAKRSEGVSKAILLKTFWNVIREYMALVFSFYFLGERTRLRKAACPPK